MKILAITDSHPPCHRGGYELRAKEVLDRLSRRGHDIAIVTTRHPRGSGSGCQDERGVFRRLAGERSAARLAVRILDELRDVMFLRRMVRAHRPDLVYLLHVTNLSKAMYPYLAECGVPVVFDEGGRGIAWAYNHHGPWFYLVEHQSRSRTKTALKSVLAGVGSRLSGGALKRQWSWPENMRGYFNSTWNRQNAEAAGVPIQGCPVIQPGVDIQTFPLAAKHAPKRPLNLIYPSRIEPKKGQRDAIRILGGLRGQGVDARLTLLGHVRDGRYEQDVEADVSSAGLAGFVQIRPMVDHKHLSLLYQQADVCVFPSYQKAGLSRVPLEAMASGCVVISYGNEGSAEVIRDRQTGYLVPEGDTDVAAQRIQELVARPAFFRDVVHKARKDVESRYSMEPYVDRVEAFLSEVAGT